MAATATALSVLLALSGCGSKGTETTTTAATDDPAARAQAVQSNPGIPPQAKEQMLRNAQSQAQQPAGTANK